MTAAVLCSKCGQGLPAWQVSILTAVATALAAGLFAGLARLGVVYGRLRDMRLRTCFLSVQNGWRKQNAGYFLPFVTPQLGEQLRRQLAELAASGQVVHHERSRIRKLRVISGGGRRDLECVARIESSVRHWVTDASSGELTAGSKQASRDVAPWRFVRGSDGDWFAAEIGVAAPSGDGPAGPDDQPSAGVSDEGAGRRVAALRSSARASSRRDDRPPAMD
jgi:hypothetical protein